MSSDRATFDSYDGVELRFLDGVTRKCAPLTVAEAAHYLRLEARIRDGEVAAVCAFASEFADRAGVLDVRLVDMAFEVVGPGGTPLALGDMTVADGLALTEVVGAAAGVDRKAAKAQSAILDTFPAKFGRDPKALAPAEVFAMARSFASELYLHIYGLAKDFCDHLTRSPRVKVMTMSPGAPSGSCSMPASTT